MKAYASRSTVHKVRSTDHEMDDANTGDGVHNVVFSGLLGS